MIKDDLQMEHGSEYYINIGSNTNIYEPLQTQSIYNHNNFKFFTTKSFTYVPLLLVRKSYSSASW